MEWSIPTTPITTGNIYLLCPPVTMGLFTVLQKQFARPFSNQF